jgi:hypothetical protein
MVAGLDDSCQVIYGIVYTYLACTRPSLACLFGTAILRGWGVGHLWLSVLRRALLLSHSSALPQSSAWQVRPAAQFQRWATMVNCLMGLFAV